MEKAVEMPRWYAIRTKPKEENRAYENLTSWGVESFAPRIRRNRHNQFTGQATPISRPLFPGYIFARFDAEKLLHKIHYTRGVQGIVSIDARPIGIEDEVIELIQAQVGDDGFIRLGGGLRRGDKVTISDGSLKGLSGIFDCYLNDSSRVMMFLEFINYQASVIVEGHFVQKAGGTLACARQP